MRSHELDLSTFNTDKGENYLDIYDRIFTEFIDKPVKLLELGIDQGGSLLLWNDYFPKGTIVGVDVKVPDIHFPERVHPIQCDQADQNKLTEIADRFADGKFDIIIDDASHIGVLTKISFWHLFHRHLKTGGYYIIEDWGTGYWDDWIDGKSMDLDNYRSDTKNVFPYSFSAAELKAPLAGHTYGMVGFVKQLIDEMAAGDVTKKLLSNPSVRLSKFESISVYPGLFIIKKAGFDLYRWEKDIELSFQHLKAGLINKSKEKFTRLLSQKEDERIYRGLAECNLAQNNDIIALDLLKKALTFSVNSPDTYYLLSQVMKKMNREQDAERYNAIAQSLNQS